MARQKNNAPVEERKTIVVIRSPEKKTTATFDTWRFWEIINALQWFGAPRDAAVEAASWAGRAAEPGARRTITETEITMEVISA